MAASSDQPSIVSIGHEHEEAGGDQELVGDRIEHAPERRLLRVGASEIAVEVIGHAGRR